MVSTTLTDRQHTIRATRVFLVGCPRSGTTLLQSMLMSSGSIESFPETHLFDRGFGSGKRAWLNRSFRGLYLWSHLVRWARAARELGFSPPRIRPSWSRRVVVRRALRALDELAIRAGKRAWIEKTPAHLHFIDRIVEHAPDARFIHLVRDGRATVASLYRAGWEEPRAWRWARSIEACIDRWNRCVAVTARRAGTPGHSIVTYEELLAGPETELRGLCAFLGVEYEDSMVRSYSVSAARVVRPSETWKARSGEALEDPGLEKFHRTFDSATRKRIEGVLDLAAFRELSDRSADG